MGIARNAPPKPSLTRLRSALAQIVPLKEARKRWMRIHPARVRSRHVLYAHPVYSIRLPDLVDGKPLGTALLRVAWMYFLRNPDRKLACAEVSIVSRKHANFRLTEGPFVNNAFRIIGRIGKDPRLRRHSFELRSVRIESLHVFVFWLKALPGQEFWVPVTPIGGSIAPERWLGRKEFVSLLVNETKRVTQAREWAKMLARGA